MTCCPNCGHTIPTETRRSLMSLTAEQKRLLRFIASFSRTYEGVSPSYDEMASAMGLNSKSGIHRLVTALEERGHIERLPNKARSIVVVGEAA